MSEQTATTVMDRAVDAYRRDVRFRTIVRGVVREAMQAHGPIDPRRPERAAHDIATEAAAILLKRIYEEDAELRAQKQIADQYRAIAEDALLVNCRPPVISAALSPLETEGRE